MQSEFDPLHEWLGIPPAQQPPTLYRMLGIQDFEGDPAVIENAADKQMLFLRQFQAGPRGRYAQELLTEVSKAKVYLFDAESKQYYDDWLRATFPQQKMSTSATPVSQVLPATTYIPAPHYSQIAQPVHLTIAAAYNSAYPPHLLQQPIYQVVPEVSPPPPAPKSVYETPTYTQFARRYRRRKSRDVNPVGRLLSIAIGAIVGVAAALWVAKLTMGVDMLGWYFNK